MIEKAPAYRHFQPFEINFDDFLTSWLRGLEKDVLYLGVNWSGEQATGYDIKPKEVLERLQYELGIIDWPISPLKK